MKSDRERFKQEFIIRLIKFSLSNIKLAECLKKEKVFYSLIDQLIRSSTSIGANIVESKSSHSKKDYIKYFEIALKSANETKYWLAIVREVSKSNNEQINKNLLETIEIANIIASSLLTLKNKK